MDNRTYGDTKVIFNHLDCYGSSSRFNILLHIASYCSILFLGFGMYRIACSLKFDPIKMICLLLYVALVHRQSSVVDA